jgi:vesicle coat complex subunit
MGSKVVPGLVAALKDKNADVRFLAALALADLGPAAKDATPSLIHTLRLTTDLRVPIVVALGKIGKAAVPELSFLLKDNDPARRYDALWAMANIGADAREAVPGILKALEDKDQDVRAKALYALFRVYPESVLSVPVVGFLGVGP